MDKKVLYGVVGVCLVFCVLMAGCTGTQNSDKKTYIVGVDGEYPPYSYIDETGKAVGFDVESIQWIAAQNGFSVEIKPVAWDGIIPALQQGKIDMVYSGMTITPERQEKADFSNPYWTVNQGIAVREDSTLTKEQVLSGNVLIGTQRGCSAHTWLDDNMNGVQMVKDGKLKLYDSFPLSLVDLQNKGVDAVIFDDINIKSHIQGKPLKMLDIIETGEQYGVAVRKGDNETMKVVNDGLAQLQASPKWQELIDKYLITHEGEEATA